tara:strand:+ start:623 stop:1042 length:420 start_codon:yes stop_codon:yes gene_type:complete
MATTTATINIQSTDMSDSAITIANTATLTNAGNDTGMTKTTGLTRVELSSSSPVTLIDAGATTRLNTIAKGKIYIKNLNDRGDGTKYVTLEMHGHEIGRLYGGDFAFFPFDGGADNDILLDPFDATTTTLEYIVLYEAS